MRLADEDGGGEVHEHQGRQRRQRAAVGDQPVAALAVVPEHPGVDQQHDQDEPVVVHEARVLEHAPRRRGQPRRRRRRQREGRPPSGVTVANGLEREPHPRYDAAARRGIPDPALAVELRAERLARVLDDEAPAARAHHLAAAETVARCRRRGARGGSASRANSG